MRRRPATGGAGPPPARLPLRPPGGRRGAGRLVVDGAVVAEGRSPLFTLAAFNVTGAGLTCGYELGPAVGRGLPGPVPLHRHHPPATITLDEHVPVNPLVEFERIMAEQ